MPEELLGGHDELDRLAGVFKLLGDPTRMRLVAELHRAADERAAYGRGDRDEAALLAWCHTHLDKLEDPTEEDL